MQSFLDGELHDARTILIADHLDACLRCGMDAGTYRWLKQRLSGLAPPEDDHQLDRLQEFVNELVEEPA